MLRFYWVSLVYCTSWTQRKGKKSFVVVFLLFFMTGGHHPHSTKHPLNRVNVTMLTRAPSMPSPFDRYGCAGLKPFTRLY